MTRPLRLEFAGGLYHVTSRGDRQEDIYLDDADRDEFLEVLAEVIQRFNWTVHAYCLSGWQKASPDPIAAAIAG